MKILGYNYKVKRNKNSRQIGYLGFCDVNKQAIHVAKEVKEEMQQSILLHEIIEALNFHLELQLDHNKITSLEGGLYQTLKDNGIDFSLLKD